MIKHLKYREIDFEKYDACLENAVQKNFFAQRKILDFQCEKWMLLQLNNYQYIMPVPLISKFGFEFVTMPLFSQQLGVFGKEDDVKINELFLNELKLFRILSYAFNQHNRFQSEIQTKKNYIIPRQNFEEVRKTYSKGRKSVLKKTENLILKTISLNEEAEKFILQHFKGLKNNAEINDFLRFLKFYEDQLIFLGATFSGKLISLAIITETEDSFGLLALISDEELKHLNAASLLIDQFLQQEISNKSFDFMGGNLRGIEIFFKSFGAQLSEYPVISNSKKQLITNFFKNK